MVRVTSSSDCGNSPKNKFAQTIGIAIESARFLDGTFPDEMIWEHSNGIANGAEAIKAALANTEVPVSIVVEHAITHGKVGATSGIATLKNGENRRFCHVIEFSNTKANKVAKIKSYF